MKHRRPFVGGNWKMNTDKVSASALARTIVDALVGTQGVDVAVFPPLPYLLTVGAILRERGSFIKLGAQNVWSEPDGPFTGEVSLAMLRDCGVSVVLAGHSERRHTIGERDALVNAKARAILASGLECILCIGELLQERERGQTDAVNERQLRTGLAGVPAEHIARLTVAYEPVWAIGTGRTATPADVQDAQSKIRSVLASLYGPEVAARVRIQYGGSATAATAPLLIALEDVDGALVGGAALKPQDFVAIVRMAAKAALA